MNLAGPTMPPDQYHFLCPRSVAMPMFVPYVNNYNIVFATAVQKLSASRTNYGQFRPTIVQS